MAWLRQNGFVLALLGAGLLAWAYPGLGATEGPLQAGRLSRWGVMLIFFLQGLSLKTGELAAGLGNYRLHTFIQAWIFIFAAVLHLGAGAILQAVGHAGLAQGFYYLALLPTTISSAILFTGAAGGNVPAAIFNTTLANVAGVFWVPAGALLFFAAGPGLQTALLADLLMKIAQLILLPLILGQILRPWVRQRNWFLQTAPRFRTINNGIIIFIVFSTLAQSFLSEAWTGIAPADLVLLVSLVSLVAAGVHAGVWRSSRWMAGRPAERLAALFCGSQKTLATGAPMAVAIFAGADSIQQVNVGLLLLPLLCYHQIQLYLAAYLVPRVRA